MKNSKLFLTSLLAAATMSVPAYALVVSNGTTDITEQSNLTGALELRGVYRAGATTVNVLVSTAEDNPLTALIHSKSSGATSGSTATLNIGSATTAVTVVAGRVEFGDVDNTNVSSTLNVMSGSKLVITGSNNGTEYRSASLLLGEWNAKTTLSVSGTMLAKSATALAGDSGMALNVSGGTLAVNGIGICQSNKSPASSLSISGNGKLILGGAGISHAAGTWSSNLGAGTIGLSAAETTIATNLNFTDATTGTTFDTTQYAFSGEGSAQTISQGATAGTIKLTGTLSGSGIVKVTGSGILDLSGATVSLSSAIQNSATVTVSSDTIFVLSDSLKVGDTGHTYSLISGGAINGWDASILSVENFRLSGASFAMRGAQANVSTPGQVAFTAGTAGNIVWAGTSGNSTWNLSAENWTLDSASTKFYTGDNVTFGAGAEANTVTLENGANLAVGTMTVEGGNYTLNVGAGNSAAISGATLTVASGASLQLSSELRAGQASALRLGFDNISVAGTLKVYTNSTDTWSKLTFAESGSGILHLYDIGGDSSTAGLTISTLQMSGNGAFTGKYDGKVDVGVLTGSGDLTLNSPTDATYNAFTLAVGDMTSYTGTVSLVKGAYGTLTLNVDSTKIGSDARIVVGADTTLAVLAGTDNSESGVNDLTNVTGSGKIKFAAAGNTSPLNGSSDAVKAHNVPYSWVTLSNNFTGTLSITSGVVDMLSQQGHTSEGWNNGNNSAINTDRLGGVTLIELNGGGLQFRNATGSFDKNISVASGNGAIRVYSEGNVTLRGEISGSGTLSHTDGGTLTLAGTVNLTGGFTNAAGTTNFTGNTTIGTLNVAAGTLSVTGDGKMTGTLASLSAGTTLSLAGTNANNKSTITLSGSTSISGNLVIGNATVDASGALDIFNWDVRQAQKITLNEGGTLALGSNRQSFNNYVSFELKGGTITGTGDGYGAMDLYGANTIAVKKDSEISATIRMRSNESGGSGNVTVDVDEGVTLLLSGAINRRDESNTTRKIVKSGSGAMTLTADNSYFAAGFDVSAGTLVAAHEKALGTGTVTVSEGASLGIKVVSTVSASAVTFNENAKFLIDLTDATVAEGTALTIISSTAISFNGTEIGSLTSGIIESYFDADASVLGTWSDYLRTWAYDGSKLTLTFTAIPEPSVFGLLAGLGALALAGTRRRRKKA